MNKSINTKRVMKHILFWLFYIIYEIINHSWSNLDFFNINATHELWTDLPMMILIVYLNLYWLMPKFHYPRRHFIYIISLLFILFLGGLYSRYMVYILWTPWDKINNYAEYLTEPKRFFIPLRIIRNTINFYPIVALTMLIKVLGNGFEREKRLREQEKQKHVVELSFLKAQIHPHFFFNTLSSLYALTLKKSEHASEMILKLSSIMHYMLYESNADYVLLTNEINLLKNYIDIEQMRFSNRLKISFQKVGNLDGKFIAPLLLLPFVENAFKHGLANEPDKTWINIEVVEKMDQLIFKIENSFRKVEKNNEFERVGLKNVKKRLQITYPGRYDLDIKNTENIFSVYLKIQLNGKN